MRRNTSCDSHSRSEHDQCSPQQACDEVKAQAVQSDLFPIPLWLGSVTLENPFIDALVPLAEFELEVDVEADIHLPTPAREIKSVRKNVSLKQCRAVPSSHSPNVVKVFITGVIHKNIQFIDACSGFVRDHSVDVKFTTIKRVKLKNPVRNPFGQEDIEFSQKTSVSEYREIDKVGHVVNQCITGSETFETFNEPIECKILGTKIREIDILTDQDRFGRINTITEKQKSEYSFAYHNNKRFLLNQKRQRNLLLMNLLMNLLDILNILDILNLPKNLNVTTSYIGY